jgi:hypothetical protein
MSNTPDGMRELMMARQGIGPERIVYVVGATSDSVRSEKLVNWLRGGLDVEKNPFRSIGAVAAALAFIASVAIILVSAEISRISGAT